MVTREQLIAEAARQRAEAAALLKSAEKRAAELRQNADDLDAVAARMRGDGLSTGNPRGNLAPGVNTAQRLRVSEGSSRVRGSASLVVAAREAGYTLRSLGEAVGVSHAFLSACAREDGKKRVPDAVRVAVKNLTGWDSWPR